MKADIIEIFESIQGEGLFVGERQIFIRFGKCNLSPRCDYCDTGGSLLPPTPRLRRVKVGEWTSERVIEQIKKLKTTAIHSVSLTGGEPLLYTEFLEKLIPEVKDLGLKIYLETNGTLPEKLKQIVKMLDYVAMDMKFPSSCDKTYWRKHSEFLKILQNSKLKPGDYFVKVVLTAKTKFNEIKKMARIIANINKFIPLILQPVTPIKKVKKSSLKQIFSYQNYAKKYLINVRVIPQIHKIFGAV